MRPTSSSSTKPRMLINRSRFNSTDSSIAAWRLAYLRYLRLEHDQLNPSTEAEPLHIPATTLFALLVDPFTAEDERVILACLNALDAVMSATPMSVRARTEALAWSAAYCSAEGQGVPEEASMRSEAFLELTHARIIELLEMLHPMLSLAADRED